MSLLWSDTLGGDGDTGYEDLLLGSYVCWRCLLRLSTQVQMHLEATLHHQGQTVCSVLGGRPHVIEMVAGGINISC